MYYEMYWNINISRVTAHLLIIHKLFLQGVLNVPLNQINKEN